MKKYLLTIFLSLLIPFVAVAQEAYAVYTSDGTLTFYYDKQKSSRSGTKYALNTASYTTPGWYDDHRTDIKKVVFTSSFSNARPTNTKWWFAIQYNDSKSNLSEIEGIEYLNTSKVTDMYRMFFGCSSLTNLDVSHFDTKNVTELSAMFYGCSSLTNLDVSNFNTSKATRMRDMFEGCSSLTKLDVSHFDTRNVTDMSYMFYKCSSLTSLDISGFDTKNVKDMKWMFSDCRSLTHLDVSHFNTGNVTDMSLMFNNCSSLKSLDVSNFNTSNVTNMKWMFSDCRSLTHLDVSHFNTGNVTDMSLMFYNCSSLKSLDVSNFNTSNVTDMNAMFYDCRNVSTLDVSRFDTSNVTNMKTMFYMCSSLTILDVSNFSTKKVTNMTSMFYICSGLSSLDVSHFDTSNVTDMSYMFLDCSALKDLNLANFITNKVVRMRETFYGCSGLTKLDLSLFETSNVTDMTLMFKGCQNLKTIFAGEGWNTDNVTSSADMFLNCTSLVGGGGTKYDANHVDKEYAHIDGGTSNPGYLTDKNAPASTDEAYAVYTEDGTLTFYYDKQKSSRIGTKYALNTGGETPGWYTDHADEIKKAVFNSSFANARPTSTYLWFAVDLGETSKLSDISGMQYLNTSSVTVMKDMFYHCSSLTSINLSNFNTANVVNMESMFNGCSVLTSLDVSNFNTEKVHSMGSMFWGCSSLTSLDINSFNTENVTDMSLMFAGCSSLTSLNVSNINTGNVIYMYNMFNGCSSLEILDVSSFNTKKVKRIQEMFKNCTSLITIYAGDDWNLDNVSLYQVNTSLYYDYNMFLNCTSLVGGAGTKYDANHLDKEYAHIDGGTSNPGYLTDKNAPASTDEAYAVYTTDGTLTFYYDNQKSSRSGTKYELNTSTPGWRTDHANDIKKAVFNSSFANARPTSTGAWFAAIGFRSILTEIVGMQYLNTSNVTSMRYMFYGCDKIATLDVSNFNTTNVTDMSSMFYGCRGLTSLDVSHFDTNKVTDMNGMFFGCSSLTSLNTSKFNTGNVTDMKKMFEDCNGLTSLDVSHFDTSKVTDMGNMFRLCSGLTNLDVSHFDTSKVTEMSGMFQACGGLTNLDVSNFDTSNVTRMVYLFLGCSGLTSLDVSHFNTSKVTDMSGMFERCSGLTSLDVSHFDTSKVTNMGYMFWDCIGLTSLDVSNFNTINVTNMRYMFCGCSGLTSLDVSHFDTSKVTDMGNMFRLCSGLTSLDVSNFDTNKIMDMQGLFFGCSGLTSLDLSSFNTSNVTYMNERGHDENNFEEVNGMFEDCINLKTIYVGEGWTTDKVTYSKVMFANCINLVGGKGTKYDANHVDKEYAHIDGGTSNPGYLTDKNATPSMNLQEYIDSKAGETSVVEVDLFKFENDLVREQTLNVSTGASYRFINGTLKRSGSLNGPVVLISGSSSVDVGTGAGITGIDHMTDNDACEIVRMEDGTLNVSQGFVEGSVGYREYYSEDGSPTATYLGNPLQDPAIRMTSDNDHFYLGEGIVYGILVCDATGADIQLDKGKIRGMGLRTTDEETTQNSRRRASPSGSREPYINSASDVYINQTTSENYKWGNSMYIVNQEIEQPAYDPFAITLYGSSVVHIQHQYQDGFTFSLYDKHDGDVVAGGDGYNITEADVQTMSVEVHYTEGPPYTEQGECFLELKNNKVYLRIKTEELPTTGCDEDWLQQKLDEIAEQNPSEPVELTICEDGITLTKNIEVAKGCKAILTGGPITSVENINFRYGGEGLFMVYGEIGFRDIKLDFMHDAKAYYNSSYFWLGDGTLNLLEGSDVTTLNGTVVGGWGNICVKGGRIMADGEEVLFSSMIVADIQGSVSVVGRKTYCNGTLSLEMSNDPETGIPVFPIFRVDDIRVTSALDIWAPWSILPNVNLSKDATINTSANGLSCLSIKGEWDGMTVGQTFVTSTSILSADYDRMTFKSLPTNRRAEFVPNEHAVKLMSCGVQSVQTGLNQLANQQNAVLAINAETTNVVNNSTSTQGLRNITIDGRTSGSTSRGRLHFVQDKTLDVITGTTMTLQNVDIDGEGGSDGLNVSGTLIIGDNVHVSDFTCFAQVQSNGRILVAGSLVSAIVLQFANGARNGQTVVKGHDGYHLTEQDLALITVEGCELQLDTVNNRIVILTGTGIQNASTLGNSMTTDGFFDLFGHRVASPRRGVYIYKSGTTTKKVFIK